MNAVVPAVLRQIDMNELIEEIDVNAIAAELDLDALVERMDVDAIAERLDLDALVARMDVNAIAQQLDLDALLERLDIDALAERIDVMALTKRMDMAEIAGGATSDVAVSGLDLFRRQVIRADATVDGIVGRVFRRKGDKRPEAPSDLTPPDGAPPIPASPEKPNELERRDVTGHYAGPVTRILGVVADVAIAGVAATGVFAAVAFMVNLFTDSSTPVEIPPLLFTAVWYVVFVLWFWIPIALFGRTIAMAFFGLAVVRRDGAIASSKRAFARALVFPFSILVWICFIGLFLGKERRALHDVAAGTTVIYDWGAREAEQPVTIRQQLSARALRHHEGETQADESGSRDR